jgi:hypothetical protein
VILSETAPKLLQRRDLLTGWVPAPAAVALHLPLRAVVGAITVLAFGRRALTAVVLALHMSLLVHDPNRGLRFLFYLDLSEPVTDS